VLEKLRAFMELTHRFREVKRDLPLPEPDGMENDAEHTYQLTIVSWFVINELQLSLDVGRVLKYCIVHDLVEAYAGDVTCHIHDPNKKRREHEAAQRIEREFPGFRDLHIWIEQYEHRSPTDAEANFVYALDKLIPMVNILIAGGTYWKQKGISLPALLNVKTSKIHVCPDIIPLYTELIAYLASREKEFFVDAA
jgi:putative hydrolase of HD superfamily